MFLYIVLLVGLGISLKFRVRKAGFLPGFSTLLERTTITEGFADGVAVLEAEMHTLAGSFERRAA